MLRLLLLAMATAMLVAACGGGDDDAPAETPTPAPSTPTAPPGTPSTPIEGTIDLAFDQPALTVYGADTGDYLNDLPLLTTGDVNGDGIDDLLIGARFGDGADNAREDSGEAYLIYGRDPLPQSLDLAAGEADVTFYGAEPGDEAGYAGLIDDVNGDGTDDVIVSAPFAEGDFGAVYVFFGGGELAGEIDLSAGGADATFTGPHATSFFGDAVSTGDFNGDGAGDLLVGATFARKPAGTANEGAQAGAAYVFFGGDGIGGAATTAAGDFDAALYGDNSEPHPDELGDNVWGADVNGDGIDDIIATAEAADGPNNERSVAAEVHILYGREDLGGVYDISAGDQDVSVIGAEQNDTLGFQLAAGDVNGDGVADLLASARGADGPGNSTGEAGEVHIVLGRSDLPETVDLLNDESDAYLYGADPAAMLGYAIGVADVDGDGRNEVLVGSGFAEASGERTNAGAVYILDASGLQGAVRVSEAPLLLVISGAQNDDALGSALTAGDLDGDGSLEIITLALRADGPEDSREDAGEIYIIKP